MSMTYFSVTPCVPLFSVMSSLVLPSGARDNTRKAIERAICVPHNFHCVHVQMKNLREKLASSLQMASQIYFDPSIKITVWNIQNNLSRKRMTFKQNDSEMHTKLMGSL